MYTLKIETKDKIMKINNPQKARLKNFILFDAIQVMNENGKWNTISYVFTEPGWKADNAISLINFAIKRHISSVNIGL